MSLKEKFEFVCLIFKIYFQPDSIGEVEEEEKAWNCLQDFM